MAPSNYHDDDGRIPNFLDDEDVNGGSYDDGDDDVDDGDSQDDDAMLLTSLGAAEDVATALDTDEAKVSYLLRYERLIRQQECETAAVVAHLRPLFLRLRVLGGEDEPPPPQAAATDDDGRGKGAADLSYEYVAFGGAGEDGAGGETIVTERERMRLLSYGGMRRALKILDDPHSYPSEDVLRTDQQLAMVLRDLVDASSSSSSSASGGGGGERLAESGGGHASGHADALSFPEFLQCYRIAVGGVQALEMLPKPSRAAVAATNGDGGGASSYGGEADVDGVASALRATAAERVRKMIQTFGRDGTLDRELDFTAGEMRKILTVKDQQFVQLMENHAREVDGLAYQNHLIRTSRKKRTLLLVAVSAALFFAMVAFAIRRPTTSTTSQSLTAQIRFPAETAGDVGGLVGDERVAWSDRRAAEMKKASGAADQAIRALEKKPSSWGAGSATTTPHLSTLLEFHANATHTIKQMATLIKSQERDVDAVQKEKAQLAGALDGSRKSSESLEATLAQLREETKRCDVTVRESASDLKRCRMNLTSTEAQLRSARDSDAATTSLLTSCRADVRKLTEGDASAASLLRSCQADLERAERADASAASELRSCRAEVGRLEGAAARAEREEEARRPAPPPTSTVTAARDGGGGRGGIVGLVLAQKRVIVSAAVGALASMVAPGAWAFILRLLGIVP